MFYVIPVVYSHPGLFVSLQNGRSLVNRSDLPLYVLFHPLALVAEK